LNLWSIFDATLDLIQAEHHNFLFLGYLKSVHNQKDYWSLKRKCQMDAMYVSKDKQVEDGEDNKEVVVDDCNESKT
jgi:hypothetical protein